MADLNEWLLPVHGPDLDGGIGSTGRNQSPAVEAERDGRHPGRSSLEGSGFLAGGRIVKLDPVLALDALADGEKMAVRTERDTDYPAGAGNRSQHGQGLARRRLKIPEDDGFVPATAGEDSVVGGNGDAADVPAMAAQGIPGAASRHAGRTGLPQ